MPYPGPHAARAHLRLAGPPVERRRVAESRALLHVRSLVTDVALALSTVLAWLGTALALAPLLWRRAPMGVRLRPLRPREARIIPFQRPRQKALPH